MKAFAIALVTASFFVGAGTARAQTPTGRFMPFGGRVFADVAGGAGASQKVDGLAGGEIGVRLSDRFDVFGEGFWIANAVTRHRLDLAHTIGSFLRGSQGGSVTSDLVVPAAYGGLGVRVVLFRKGSARIYGAVSGGAAHVALQPVFEIAGEDVTAVLPDYGVVLGQDLTGETSRPAFDATIGVRLPKGRWYLDGRVGAISIRTPGQAMTVVQVGGGLGLRF